MLTWRWFAARFAGALITLLGVTVVVFIVLRAIPGDAITASLGIESGTLTPEQRASLNHFYGIDKPWYVQYGKMLGNIAQGDFGTSLKYEGQSVNDILRRTLPVSERLDCLHTFSHFPLVSSPGPLPPSARTRASITHR